MNYCRRLMATALGSFLLACAAQAQTAALEPNSPGDKHMPTVTFELLFPDVRPAHYTIAVESSGRALYQSGDEDAGRAKAVQGIPHTLRYTLRFIASAATRTRIFDLARQAGYFQGNFDYTKHRVANTGSKTLTYSASSTEATPASPPAGVGHTTTYNYSENPAIQQLTAIFQGISASAELAARLEHLRRFDRLGLDEELRQAEEMAQNGQLVELQVAIPALQAVVDDPSALNIARQRALHLLRLASAAAARP